MSEFTKNFLKAVGIIIALLFLWAIRDVIAILFGAIILSSATAPLVDKLQDWRLPRVIGGLLVYIGLILLIIGLLTLIIPPLAKELAQLAVALPDFLKGLPLLSEGQQTLTDFLAGSQAALQNLSQQFGQISEGIFRALAQVAGGVVSLIVILIIAFYLSVQDQGIKRFLEATVPKVHHQDVLRIVERSQKTLSHWLQAELLTGTAVGLMTFVGLSILGIKFALLLSLLAFLFELIPFLGPILAAIPAVVFAFSQSVTLGLLVIVLYVIVQQTENHILVPQVMRRVVGLNPIFVILALLIGAKLGGIAGILLAVPLLAITLEFLATFYGFKFQLNLPPPVEPTRTGRP